MLININEVDFGYNEETVLEGINLTINDGDKIGLIGNNGAGKTTLLRLILGELEPTNGDIFFKSALSIGYLQQNSGLNKDTKVYNEMLSIFDAIFNNMDALEHLSERLSTTPSDTSEYRKLTLDYDNLHREIIAKDGYNIEFKIKTILNGMGFIDKYDQIISTMSGGEKTRLAIAKLLLESPNVLILDEPTNHLDFKTLIWLEEYLTSYKGALLIVSHDRYFLDRMIKNIWELEDKGCYTYSGNYSKFKKIKAELLSFRLKEYEKQSNQIASMLDYAARNIARATTSKSAKSRLHQLENIEVLKKPRTFTKPPHFAFTFDAESTKEVINVANMPLSIDGKQLITSANFTIYRQERVAVLGANGTGKSTLIKAIVGKQDFRIKFGCNVKIGYYDQENLNINFNNTALDELWNRHHLANQTEMRSILGGLLLGAEDIYKPIGVLSGGERAKLGFAIIMAEHGNTLILDEPTNHLDLMTREALEDALAAFEGTILFVSHDRYFLNRIATRILEIDNLELNSYEGNYDKYEEQKKAAAQKEAQLAQEKQAAKPPEKKAYRTSKDRNLEVMHKQKIQQCEADIAVLEGKLAELEEQMYAPQIACDYIKYGLVSAEHANTKIELDAAYASYFALIE